MADVACIPWIKIRSLWKAAVYPFQSRRIGSVRTPLSRPARPSLRKYPAPSHRPGEVVVKVKYANTCHTERDNTPGSATFPDLFRLISINFCPEKMIDGRLRADVLIGDCVPLSAGCEYIRDFEGRGVRKNQDPARGRSRSIGAYNRLKCSIEEAARERAPGPLHAQPPSKAIRSCHSCRPERCADLTLPR